MTVKLAHKEVQAFDDRASDGSSRVNSRQEVELQPASLDIWDKKYRLKRKDGVAVDVEIDDTFQRVAKALADVETTDEARKTWGERFLRALRRGAIPAGRIVSNAGAREHKPATSTINCTVSGIVGDSMADILDKVHEAGLTLKAGCGIGYDSRLCVPRARTCPAQALIHPVRCHSWTSTTRCVSRSLRPADVAAHKWPRSISAIPMCWNSSVPSERTAGCVSSIFRC